MTGIMTGIMTGVTGDEKLVFTAVELDCYAYSWCIHTPSSDIQQGWYAGINIPLHWVLLSHFTNLFITWSYDRCVRQSNFVHTSLSYIFFLYQSVIYCFVYTSQIVYRIHLCPRGGERLAGRYNAEERLRRLLRAGRCAGRVRSVGTSREGRSSSHCRAAGSGKAAASTSMWVSGRRWRDCRG